MLIEWTSFAAFLYTWIALAIIVFFILLRVKAPYGRHSSTGWGPLISNRTGWLIMELPVLSALIVLVFPYLYSLSNPVVVMLGLFSFHYVNRIFIFPFRLKTAGKKMPIVVIVSGIFFNLVNGFSIGYYFTRFANYSSSWFIDPRFISGIIFFFTGLLINLKSDNILINLRRPGETHYVLPKKWLFNYISCPNLFGELLEWLGFALLCWNLPTLSFFIWTAANLIPRALSHHKWYKEKFKNYPPDRKAIVPFVL